MNKAMLKVMGVAMAMAVAIAMLSANALGSTPIYDQLTRRAVSAFKVNAVEASTHEPVAAGHDERRGLALEVDPARLGRRGLGERSSRGGNR